jgi:hypothetical protein
MKRREFILITGVGAAMTTVTSVSCDSDSQWTSTLALPTTMGQFCTKKELITLGSQYTKDFPAEAKKAKIQKLLLQDAGGKPIEPSSQKKLLQQIEEKSVLDFENGNTVIVNGWVLSRTEARQCALYFLTNPDL